MHATGTTPPEPKTLTMTSESTVASTPPTLILTEGGYIAEMFSSIYSFGYLWYNLGIKILQLAVFKRN
jgi:hypothetical protein